MSLSLSVYIYICICIYIYIYIERDALHYYRRGFRNMARLVRPEGLLFVAVHAQEQDAGFADQWPLLVISLTICHAPYLCTHFAT